MSKKTTVQLLEEVSGHIDTAITNSLSAKKKSSVKSELTALQTSVSAALKHLTDNEKRKFIEVRKNLKAVSNIIEGTLEGLASGEMTRPEFKGTMNTLRTRFYPSVCSSISAEIEKSAVKPASLSEDQLALKAELAECSDLKDALKVIKSVKDGAVHPAQGNNAATVEQLKELSGTRGQLPVNLRNKDFALIRMPIVPIFSTYEMNKASTFDKLAIKHLQVEGYAVLLNQTLVVVSDSKAGRMDMTPKAFAESVVSLLNEKGTIEYEFVSDIPVSNPRNADLKLFWILSKQKMSVLTDIALSGRKASTVKWGFPF